MLHHFIKIQRNYILINTIHGPTNIPNYSSHTICISSPVNSFKNTFFKRVRVIDNIQGYITPIHGITPKISGLLPNSGRGYL
mmetsp:Transcript_1403/g.130  ORF Transcript_1403/g.130 Transcript_1403/m.130 type:complete len:82 (-) Transcript_1403:22-267(-)